METNCPARFGEALDSYQKSLSRRNYEGALLHIESAIECCPYPPLYSHLTACRDSVVKAQEQATYEKNRKWYQPRKPATT